MCKTYKLCPKFCHLQENVVQCSHYDILECDGICRGTETVENYNLKVRQFITDMNSKAEDYFIREKGRKEGESSIIIVQNNIYIGYAFIENDIPITNMNDIMPFVKLQKNTFETQQILTNYIAKNVKKIYSFKNFSTVND